MKRIRHLLTPLFFILVALFATTTPVLAQTTLDTTTLDVAIDNDDQTLDLGATTNVEVGDTLVIDREAMRVNAIPVSGYVTVARGVSGTAGRAHGTTATVIILPPGAGASSEVVPGSTCTSTSEPYTPRVVLPSGNRYQCTNSTWYLIGPDIGSFTVSFVQGGTAADALDTIFFIADRSYTVVKVDAVWGTAESTGTMDIMVEKLTGTTACGSGTDVLSAAIDATGTANTVTAGSLSATASALAVDAGGRLCVDLSATPNEVVNMVVNVTLVPR